MKKEFARKLTETIGSDKEAERFVSTVREITGWGEDEFDLKKINTFNSLLHCYEANGVSFDGVPAALKEMSKHYAQKIQAMRYSIIGPYSGAILKEAVEKRLKEYN